MRNQSLLIASANPDGVASTHYLNLGEIGTLTYCVTAEVVQELDFRLEPHIRISLHFPLEPLLRILEIPGSRYDRDYILGILNNIRVLRVMEPDQVIYPLKHEDSVQSETMINEGVANLILSTMIEDEYPQPEIQMAFEWLRQIMGR